MSVPMTGEHLDEIDELLHNNEQVPNDLVRLLADEADRLRAENDLMRPIVEWMSQAFVSYGPGRPGDTSVYRMIPKHLIEQARTVRNGH